MNNRGNKYSTSNQIKLICKLLLILLSDNEWDKLNVVFKIHFI